MKTITAMLDPDDPNLLKETDAVPVNLEVQEFDVDSCGIESIEDVDDKLIGYLEKLIRKSYEYKQYIGYLKSELDITSCALIPTLDIKDLGISLEFHHYPFTLYDIVNIIVKKYLDEKDEDNTVSMFNVMETVMKEHYDGNIGLVPLSKSMHEMAHNGSVKIPISAVYGNYGKFINKYREYIDPDLMTKITLSMSIDDEEAKEFNTKINKNILHYNINYNKKDED